MVDSKHQWKAWVYLLPAIVLLLIFTVWPICNTVVTAFIYDVEYKVAEIQVEPTDNGYRFFRTDSNTNEKQYLFIGADENGAAELQYAADATNVYTYDGTLGAWTTTANGKTYLLGATPDSDMTVIDTTGLTEADMYVKYYSAQIYGNGKNVTADLQADQRYQFRVYKGIPEAFVYVTGTASEGFISTTQELDTAANIRGEKLANTNSYKLFLYTKGEANQYVNVAVDANGTASLQYAEATECAFAYNETSKAWVCNVGGTDYYLALDGTTGALGAFPLSTLTSTPDTAPQAAGIYKHRTETSEVDEPQMKLMGGNNYRIGAHRKANGTQFYVTDADSQTSGLMLSTNINGESSSKFGIHNFVEVLTHKGSDFMVCLKNTLILTVITVPISTILALLIAVALNSIKPLQRFLQTIFFLPYVTNSIAIGMVFAAMFNIVGFNTTSESVGIINNILGVFGIERINWINQGAPAWASFTALIIYIVWNALPFKILILLGGLQSINKQYYDAAKIDSTPKWRVLTRITLPLLSPMLTYTDITSFIGGFKEYSSVVGIFGDGKAVPGGANMNTIVGHIQNHLTETRDYGLAGAAALMLFAIIFVVTMINLRISKKNTHY